MADIGPAQLGAAIGVHGRTVRNAVANDDAKFSGYWRTPGNYLRWEPKRAAEIVRSFGKVPPAEWESRTGKKAPR